VLPGALHDDGTPLRADEYAIAYALRGESVEQRRQLYRRGDGRLATFAVSAVPVYDAAGRLVRAVGTWTDVTERDALENALRQARDAAEAASHAKTQFVANMSHELRTPLNAISGHVQLLEMELHGPVTPAQRDALGRVQRAQRHLLGLINDVLNFAKLESGAVEFDVRVVTLADVVADVVPMIQPQLAAKGLDYRVDIPDPALAVWADREKLVQVLLNLVSNAVKFTPAAQADGTPGRVTVEVAGRDETPDVAYLRVHDTGVGIPDARQETIFDPFVQVRTGYSQPIEGTGLGLAISRDLARGMGGDIRVRSVEGAWSTFTVSLRRAASADGEPASVAHRHMKSDHDAPNQA
jgi:signal transduction histidine kinase